MPGPKISKMVTHRQKRFTTLTMMAQFSRADLVETPSAVGEEPVFSAEAAAYLGNLMARLAGTYDNLIQTEHRHLDAQAPDALLRGRQSAVLSAVRDELFHLRDLCGGAFGREQAAQLAFERRIAKDPTPLLRQGLRIESRLRDPEVILVARRPGIHIDRHILADGLQDLLRELRAASDEMTDKLARIQRTKVDKDKAMHRFDETYRTAATSLVGALRLVGKHEIADRVPVNPRPRSKVRSEVETATDELVTAAPNDVG